MQGREEVFSFLEGVLSEVLRLFPSKYIHVGGDEVSVMAEVAGHIPSVSPP